MELDSARLRLSISRHLALFILSIIVIVVCVSYYSISGAIKENEQREIIISKLDTLQAEANNNLKNVTVINPKNLTVVVPNGKISSLGPGSLEILNISK